MNQNEFFNILVDGFKELPESKLRDILSYYDNKFTHGLASGKTEEEIITELGNPNLIVNQYKSEFLDGADISTPFYTDNYNSSADTKNLNDDKLNYYSSSEAITNDNVSTTNTDDSLDADSTKNLNNFSISTNDNINNYINDESNNINPESNLSSSSFLNSSEITTDEALSTANISDNNSDFTFIDNINQDSILVPDNNLNNSSSTKPYEDVNSNDNFYNLYTENSPVKNKEDIYDSNSSSNRNYNNNDGGNSNSKSSNSHSTVNFILKFCIVGLTLLIFSPVITGIIGCIIGLFGVAISILVGSIGLLVGGTFTSLVGVPNVPMFVANFPYPVIVLFSLGSISLSLFLTLVFYYLCKFFVRLSIKAYRALKLKGGDL